MRLIYEQKDGAAMGSPVYAVIANLYMEEFEERAIATATYKPKIDMLQIATGKQSSSLPDED